MAFRVRMCPSSSVRTPQRTHAINHRSSSSVSIRTARVGISTLHEASKKAYHHAEPNNDRLSLPEGWRRRRMEL